MNIYKRARGRRLPRGGAVGLSTRCPDLGTRPAAPSFEQQITFSIHEDREKIRLEGHEKRSRTLAPYTRLSPLLNKCS